ncbi:MAG: hypothetical protein KAH01_03635, partial [Caldisericia bacterium]|nr:hypothetical protein [Caldisericia bacterium]
SSDAEYSEFHPSVKFMDDKNVLKTMSSKTFVKKMMESYASAGVIPTHTEDAVDMAKIINQWMEKYGITPVHDAIVIPGEDADKVGNDFNRNIGETSRDYSMVSAVADAMREVYRATVGATFSVDIGNQKGEKQAFDIKLDDMRTPEEKAKDKKKAKSDPQADKPRSFVDELFNMENTAEIVWSERERKIFANDIKLDQLPTTKGSMHELKAEYKKERYQNELIKRINRRLDNMDPSQRGQFDTEEKIKKFAIHILHLSPSATKTMSEKQKIIHNLDIITQVTNALNGEC